MRRDLHYQQSSAPEHKRRRACASVKLKLPKWKMNAAPSSGRREGFVEATRLLSSALLIKIIHVACRFAPHISGLAWFLWPVINRNCGLARAPSVDSVSAVAYHLILFVHKAFRALLFILRLNCAVCSLDLCSVLVITAIRVQKISFYYFYLPLCSKGFHVRSSMHLPLLVIIIIKGTQWCFWPLVVLLSLFLIYSFHFNFVWENECKCVD